MAYVKNEDLKRQLSEAERQISELAEVNRQLLEEVPKQIRELISESDEFTDFKTSITQGKAECEGLLQNARQETERNLQELVAKKDDHMLEVTNIENALAERHKGYLDNCNSKKNELNEKKEEAEKSIASAQEESISNLESALVEGKKSLDADIEAGKKVISDLTNKFKELAGDAYSAESSKVIVDEYRKNATYHQDKETLFQWVGGSSIGGAIIVLLFWLIGVIDGRISTETEYHWLPVATITSLFLFLSRWAARIAYRHGLEARRLNQYALDLTAMPAFFAQELLNQGDKEFQTEGKKIVQAKASKMFGNIERFDEQHSHSPMELVWKWVTKKFETADNGEAITSPSEDTPPQQKKTVSKKPPATPSE